jgi:hypothetical protein
LIISFKILRDINYVYDHFYINKKLTWMFFSYQKKKGKNIGIIFAVFGVASWTFIIKKIVHGASKIYGKNIHSNLYKCIRIQYFKNYNL